MDYYKKTKLDLYNFEAWGGAIDTLEKIKALGIIYQVEDYIADTFHEYDYITDRDINGLLWFDMDQFFKDMENWYNNDLLEYYTFNQDRRWSNLYAVIDDGRVMLLADEDIKAPEKILLQYIDLKPTDLWIKDGRLHINNKHYNKVDIYEPKIDRLIKVNN